MKRLFALTLLLPATVLLAACTGPNKVESNRTSDNSPVESEVGQPEYNSDDLFFDDEAIEEVEVVTEDVYGEDISIVERHPGSIRSYYEAYEGEISVTYQTTVSQEEVRKHFKQELLADGWINDGEGTDFADYSRDGDDGEEYLSVYYYPYPSQGLLEYELYYESPLEGDEEFDSDGLDDLIFE